MKLRVVHIELGETRIVNVQRPTEILRETGWKKKLIITALVPTGEAPTNAILSRSEVAEWLGVHPMTIAYWCKNNRIPFQRVGKNTAYNKHKILAWLQKQNEACDRYKKKEVES